MDDASAFGRWIGAFDGCPWGAVAGRHVGHPPLPPHRALYTEEERRRRDQSRWTTVQAVLAPLQFLVFLVSLCLVVNYLATGTGLGAATASIVVKTGVLFTIMVTGSLWEHDVYGRYLFAPAFFWEDAVSFIVIALHTAYLYALLTGAMTPTGQMVLALAAYATYFVNALQFVLKLRAARRQGSRQQSSRRSYRMPPSDALGLSR